MEQRVGHMGNSHGAVFTGAEVGEVSTQSKRQKPKMKDVLVECDMLHKHTCNYADSEVWTCLFELVDHAVRKASFSVYPPKCIKESHPHTWAISVGVGQMHGCIALLGGTLQTPNQIGDILAIVFQCSLGSSKTCKKSLVWNSLSTGTADPLEYLINASSL